MKQIYNFEKVNPPLLNERTLRAKAEKKQQERAMFLLALSAVIIEIGLILCTLLSAKENPSIAAFSFLYLIISAVGSGILLVLLFQKRKELVLWQEC